MSLSFIFCYRNRKHHLEITIPRIRDLFPSAEIVVSEQNDDLPFRRGNVLNEGVKAASNDVVVCHDIDHIPIHGNETYYDGVSDFYLPIKKVIFVYNNLQEKPMEEVPGGYRHFRDSVDDNYAGGIEVFKKDAFYKINGFPSTRCWGLEDAVLLSRAMHYQLTISRDPSNTFYALDHKVGAPPVEDPDFQYNVGLAQNWKFYLDDGIKTQYADVVEIKPKHKMVDRWILCNSFDKPNVFTQSIISTPFNFDEGEE